MARFVRRPGAARQLPAGVRDALGLAPGERVLAHAAIREGGSLVATNHGLHVVDPSGQQQLSRAWHLVDAGTWSHDQFQLTVTWVDGSHAGQWVLPEPSLLPETVRERVQASVVLSQRLSLGERRQARVVIRQDLAGGGLVEQVVLGRGVRADAPGVQDQTDAALADLREQVGLD